MIGIDISDLSIKVVQLSNKTPRRLLSYCSEILPEGAIDNGVIVQKKVVQQYVHKALTQCRISPRDSDILVASIPETQSFLRVIEIPEMDEDEVSEAIRWEVSQHIPFGLENVYIDWQQIADKTHKASPGRQEVQVGAAQRKVVDSLYETLSPLNMDIAAFELESQAIVRALISDELQSKQGLLVVDLGASATNVMVHDHGALRFTATLQKGVSSVAKNLASNDRETVQKRLDALKQEDMQRLSDQLIPSMEELAVEVKSIVEFYNSIDAQHEVKEIILTGGGSNMPSLDKAFLKYFDNVHVQRGNPWVNILEGKDMRPPMDIKESVRYSTALGLALREVIV